MTLALNFVFHGSSLKLPALERHCFYHLGTSIPFRVSVISTTIINYPKLENVIFVNLILAGRKRGIQRGIPDMLMMRDNRAQRIDMNYLPSPHQAARMYEDAGGRLTDPAPFGTDPIADCPEKKRIRDCSFTDRYPSVSELFHEVVNDNSHNFKLALLFYIDITRRLSLS